MDDLVDPYGDRVMKNVPMIASKPITVDELWKKGSKYKLQVNIERVNVCSTFRHHPTALSTINIFGDNVVFIFSMIIFIY